MCQRVGPVGNFEVSKVCVSVAISTACICVHLIASQLHASKSLATLSAEPTLAAAAGAALAVKADLTNKKNGSKRLTNRS